MIETSMSIEFLKNDLDKVNYLSNLLSDRATGGFGNEQEYILLRGELLKNPELAEKLPEWLKLNRNLSSFWGFIKAKFRSYEERRVFITTEFEDVCNYLEFGKNLSPSPIPTAVVSSQQPVVFPNPYNYPFNKPTPVVHKNKVFIVHGRDNEAKQEVARFVSSVGLIPIILHEQASSGMTIIEKIEHYSGEAGYGIVLYTPCDQGRGFHEKNSPPKLRARQNVVFEHGYLMAKLKRENVCALVKGDLETPNDISGVVYVDFDVVGAWKIKIAQELKKSGYQIRDFV